MGTAASERHGAGDDFPVARITFTAQNPRLSRPSLHPLAARCAAGQDIMSEMPEAKIQPREMIYSRASKCPSALISLDV